MGANQGKTKNEQRPKIQVYRASDFEQNNYSSAYEMPRPKKIDYDALNEGRLNLNSQATKRQVQIPEKQLLNNVSFKSIGDK